MAATVGSFDVNYCTPSINNNNNNDHNHKSYNHHNQSYLYSSSITANKKRTRKILLSKIHKQQHHNKEFKDLNSNLIKSSLNNNSGLQSDPHLLILNRSSNRLAGLKQQRYQLMDLYNNNRGREEVSRVSRLMMTNDNASSHFDNVDHQNDHHRSFLNNNNLITPSSIPTPSSSVTITSSVNSTYVYFQQHFPSVNDFVDIIPTNLLGSTSSTTASSSTLVATFLLMYQSHSQRILDTFQLANVEELERTITHFWSEMPAHMGLLMSHPFLLVLIECCDTLLYRVSDNDQYSPF